MMKVANDLPGALPSLSMLGGGESTMSGRSIQLRLNLQFHGRGSGLGVWQAQDPYSCWESLF
jgi:hypothetical protein